MGVADGRDEAGMGQDGTTARNQLAAFLAMHENLCAILQELALQRVHLRTQPIKGGCLGTLNVQLSCRRGASIDHAISRAPQAQVSEHQGPA